MLVVFNSHAADCGTPPALGRHDEDDNRYISYFENQHGEQALFVYDPDLDDASLMIGDAEWGNIIRNPVLACTTILTDLPVVRPADDADRTSAVVLNQPEATWISACLAAIEPMRRYAARRQGAQHEDSSEARDRLLAELAAEIASVGIDPTLTGIDTGAGLRTLAAAIAELHSRGETSAANLIHAQFTQMITEVRTRTLELAERKAGGAERLPALHADERRTVATRSDLDAVEGRLRGDIRDLARTLRKNAMASGATQREVSDAVQRLEDTVESVFNNSEYLVALAEGGGGDATDEEAKTETATDQEMAGRY